MARRLLTVGLLLTALAWCGRTAAKPPDLPLGDKDTLTPQDPLAAVEAPAPSQPNPFPQAAEPGAPAMETSSFLQMRPSVRRMIGACLLYGVHPLLTLTPTADYLDFDEEDAPAVPAVFVQPEPTSDRGIPIVGPQPEQLHVMPQESPQAEQLHVTPQESQPDDATQSVCPWMRQQQCAPRQEAPAADFDEAPDVLHNLQMLHQARTLLEKAQELGRSGRVGDALVLLQLAHDLCRGSRIDEAVQEAAVYLFVPFYCGSSSYDFGAEESEPPAEKTKEEKVHEDGCEECPGCGGLSLCRTLREGEIEQKLALPVSVTFHDVPLREVIDDLRGWQDINIYVDKAALDAEEISLDHPISIQLDNLSLRSTLILILKQAHLAYVVQEDVLQITTERGARGKLQRVCYAVADLLEGDLHCAVAPADAGNQPLEEVLMKLVARTVCPQEWSERGGPCTIDFHPLTHSLVVNAPPDMQEQIVDLLNALRRVVHADADEEEERQGVGPHEGCKMLLKACHAAMDAGRHCEAADLAAKAYALDPEQAAADPLVYKMHLAGDESEPVDITPCLPPVDPDTPAALEQLYRESVRSAPASEEEEEPPTAEPPHGSFEFGFGLDGSVQMFGQLHRGGSIWHLFFGQGSLAVWSAPDGGADLAPAAEMPADGDWDY